MVEDYLYSKLILFEIILDIQERFIRVEVNKTKYVIIQYQDTSRLPFLVLEDSWRPEEML